MSGRRVWAAYPSVFKLFFPRVSSSVPGPGTDTRAPFLNGLFLSWTGDGWWNLPRRQARHGRPRPPKATGTASGAATVFSSLVRPVQRSWQHETALRVCGDFKRSQPSHTFLVALGQKLHVGAASSAVCCGNLFNVQIIGALQCWPKRN